MVDILDDTEPVTILVNQPGPYEDFSTYIHGGEPASPYLTLPDVHTIQATNMPRIATCYLQKEMPIGTNDFTLNFSINASLLQENTTPGGVGGTLSTMFTNLVTTTDQQKGYLILDGLLFTIREYTCNPTTEPTCTTPIPFYLLQIRSRSGTTTEYWQEWAGQLNTNYNIEIKRTAGVTRNVSMKIYDASGALLATRTIKDSTVINYFLPMCGRGGGGADALLATGIAQGFTLAY